MPSPTSLIDQAAAPAEPGYDRGKPREIVPQVGFAQNSIFVRRSVSHRSLRELIAGAPGAGAGGLTYSRFEEIRADIGLFLDRIVIAKRRRRPAFPSHLTSWGLK